MFRNLIGAIVGLALAGMVTAAPCLAMTYYFQSDLFTDFTPDDATNIYDDTMSISGYLVFDTALAANNREAYIQQQNGTDGDIANLIDFKITDGVNTITLADTTDYGIAVTTDSSGDIWDWSLDLQKFDRDNPDLLNNVMIIAATSSNYASTGGEIDDYSGAGSILAPWFTDLGIATNSLSGT